MPNAQGEPAGGSSMRAPARLAVRDSGRDAPPTEAGLAPPTGVDAHVLLNAFSIVLLGAATLDESWDSLSPAERRATAARIHCHAVDVADRVKELVRHPAAPVPRVIGSRRRPAHIWVHVLGPLDGVTGDYLRERTVQAGVEPGCEEVLLNLYSVTSIDVPGLAALARVRRELSAAGVRLTITDPPDEVHRSLEEYGLAEPTPGPTASPD